MGSHLVSPTTKTLFTWGFMGSYGFVFEGARVLRCLELAFFRSLPLSSLRWDVSIVDCGRDNGAPDVLEDAIGT